MEYTKLIYMEQMQSLECVARVIGIKDLGEGKFSIILDQTVFYPQGGGQPFDNGVIQNQNVLFKVMEVRFTEGQVHHIGSYETGSFAVGDKVNCIVDQDRRTLNTRLHSAGHLLDMGLKELNKPWKSVKGYHFSQGPYVEYMAEDNVIEENLKTDLENKLNEIIGRNIETEIKFMGDQMVNGKPARIVYYGEFGVPCGGTHCKNLNEIKKIEIRKIKKDKDAIRVSYEIA